MSVEKTATSSAKELCRMSPRFKPNPEHTSCAIKGLAEFNDMLGRLSDVREHLLLLVLAIMYWGKKKTSLAPLISSWLQKVHNKPLVLIVFNNVFGNHIETRM